MRLQIDAGRSYIRLSERSSRTWRCEQWKKKLRNYNHCMQLKKINFSELF